jgi:hypothetical protein
MGATWPAGATDVREQCRVGTRDLPVVVLDRNCVEDAANEGSSRRPTGIVCEFDADEKLSRGDRGDRDIVFVRDQPIEVASSSFGIDEHGRIKDQAGH